MVTPSRGTFADAKAAFARGDYAGARRIAEAILADRPTDEDALALLDDAAIAEEAARMETEAEPVPAVAGYSTDMLSPSQPFAPDPAAEEARRIDASGAFDDLRVDDGRRGPPRVVRVPPVGVFLLAVFHLLVGVVLLVLVLFLGYRAGFGGFAGAAALASVPLVLAYGLWSLRAWAWFAAVVLEGVSIAFNAAGGARVDAAAVVAIAIAIGILAYLIAARRAFFPPADAAPERPRSEAP